MHEKGRDRHPDWSRQMLLAEMRRDPSLSVAEIIRNHTLEGQSHKTLERDIAKWKKRDPEFAAQYLALQEERGFKNHQKNEQLKIRASNWREEFVRVYLLTGSKVAALRLSPFKYIGSIQERLDPNNKLYDQKFAVLMDEATEQLNSEAESVVVEAMRDSEASASQRAGIALRWLQSRSPETWGKKVEQTVKGKVEHEHTVRNQRIQETLWKDQQSFFNKAPDRLLEGRVIDAEVVGPRDGDDGDQQAPHLHDDGPLSEVHRGGKEQGYRAHPYDQRGSDDPEEDEHGELLAPVELCGGDRLSMDDD